MSLLGNDVWIYSDFNKSRKICVYIFEKNYIFIAQLIILKGGKESAASLTYLRRSQEVSYSPGWQRQHRRADRRGAEPGQGGG